MIELTLINQSKKPLPRAFLKAWVADLEKALRARRVRIPAGAELTLVFMDPRPAKALNLEYRGRAYATDVLSFTSETPLGDLVMCPQVLERQAKEHDLSFREELGYMVIHGVLHLLGYDHEINERDAKVMFTLQDAIFEKLCAQRVF